MAPDVDFQALFRASPNPYMVLDRELRFVEANDAYLRVTGTPREDLLGRNLFDVFPNDPNDPDNDPARTLRASFERVLSTGAPDTMALIRYRVPGPDGTEDRYWSATHTPVCSAKGEVAYILQHTVDVTELQKLKEAASAAGERGPVSSEQLEADVLRRAQIVQEENSSLAAERRWLRELFEQAPGFMCILRGPTHVFELANAAYLRLIGRDDIIGKAVGEALPEISDQVFLGLLDGVRASGKPFVGRAVPIVLEREGSREDRYLDFVYQPVFAADGSVQGIFVQGHDITDQKRAEDELRTYREHLEELVRERTHELQLAEAELRQAQRIEAVGKLTGGVAHDFNNLLQVIAGNLQLLEADIPPNGAAERRLKTAIAAVERGAKLSSQLLAFARRQPLEPTVVNLARVLTDIEDLVRRPLGTEITIETDVAGALWNTFADRNQIENVILNLAINARDAMRGRGTLRISAHNTTLGDDVPDVAPGEYVCLSVADDGCGMPAEVLDRVFEPFFTTKPAGEGTGLGLSMVYGFVKQTGGHVTIDSEVGRGTTINIFLARSHAAETPRATRATEALRTGSETVLVVEDDPAVRATVLELLSGLGYRVIEAPDADAALRVLTRGMKADLLFTDVLMPGQLRAPELARRAKALLPDLRVLFTSGYAEDAIVHEGRLDAGVSLLRKPYRREDLARKIREALRPTGRLRILLVEDDADLRTATEDMLKLLGHDVAAVGSVREAEVALAGSRFDTLFTDVHLTDASGIELARAAILRDARLRVVLATGAPDGAHGIDRAIVLPKPYDFDTIERALACDAPSA